MSKRKKPQDPLAKLFREVYEAPVLTAFNIPKPRRRFFPYCRLSWGHWGVGVFFYHESHATELAISCGPICVGWYYIR